MTEMSVSSVWTRQVQEHERKEMPLCILLQRIGALVSGQWLSVDKLSSLRDSQVSARALGLETCWICTTEYAA